ncbi:MAG: hypothetical protein HYR85_12520 [Planctomycetes bacterium]|nr:hypothetical protein [Planctomycetota bacterium]
MARRHPRSPRPRASTTRRSRAGSDALAVARAARSARGRRVPRDLGGAGAGARTFDSRRSAFRLVGLDAGTYLATAFTGKAWTGAAQVEVPPGGSTAFNLALSPAPKSTDDESGNR